MLKRTLVFIGLAILALGCGENPKNPPGISNQDIQDARDLCEAGGC